MKPSRDFIKRIVAEPGETVEVTVDVPVPPAETPMKPEAAAPPEAEVTDAPIV